jgi:hypothetical protein
MSFLRSVAWLILIIWLPERPQDWSASEERRGAEITFPSISQLRTQEERAGMLQLLILVNLNSRTPLHGRAVEQFPTTAMAS